MRKLIAVACLKNDFVIKEVLTASLMEKLLKLLAVLVSYQITNSIIF